MVCQDGKEGKEHQALLRFPVRREHLATEDAMELTVYLEQKEKPGNQVLQLVVQLKIVHGSVVPVNTNACH